MHLVPKYPRVYNKKQQQEIKCQKLIEIDFDVMLLCIVPSHEHRPNVTLWRNMLFSSSVMYA